MTMKLHPWCMKMQKITFKVGENSLHFGKVEYFQ